MNLHPRQAMDRTMRKMWKSRLVAVLLVLGLLAAELGSPAPVLAIVDGGGAASSSWPWMAALVEASNPDAQVGQFCGGSLVQASWVLTAAHCVEGITAGDIHIVLGSHNLSTNDGERIPVTQVIIDPSGADIALLGLTTPSLQLTLPLSSSADGVLSVAGTPATVIGWGQLSEDGGTPDTLQQTTVPIVSSETCNQAYPGDITAGELCAGLEQGGKDSCYGDSGGPLVVSNGEGGYVQAGVVSWGDGCGRPSAYGVYAGVANSANWINSQVSGNPESEASNQSIAGTEGSVEMDEALAGLAANLGFNSAEELQDYLVSGAKVALL